jgi:hypothetical protein
MRLLFKVALHYITLTTLSAKLSLLSSTLSRSARLLLIIESVIYKKCGIYFALTCVVSVARRQFLHATAM